MIKIVVKILNQKIESIIVKGHANSGAYGNDLVCAAVSAIITGGVNAMVNENEDNPNFQIDLKEGYAEIIHKESCPYSKEDEVKLQTIYVMLKTIQESNPKFVKIEEKN